MALKHLNFFIRKQDNADKEEYSLEERRNKFLSNSSLLCIPLIGLHVILDFYEGFIIGGLLDLLTIFIFTVIYYLCRYKKYTIAKLIFLLVLNIILFTYSSISPKEIGVYLLFFPLLVVTFILFDYKETFIGLGFSFLSLVLLVTLELSDFQIFGDINIFSGSQRLSFLLNLIIGSIVLILSINFLININYKASLINKLNAEKQKKLVNDIKEKNNVLEKTNKELDRFVYSISHNLRAPICTIHGIINIAMKEGNGANRKKYFLMIRSSLDRLDSFIKEINHYFSNNHIKTKKEAIDLTKFTKEIIEDNKFLEGAEKIKFVTNYEVSRQVETDKYRLQVILNSLISNAVNYSNEGLDDPVVEVTVTDLGNNLSVRVADNGLGIREEDFDKIFDMFYRGSTLSNGAGLGLYIVKEMVEKMGGEIKLKSKINKGSEFSISVPVS